MKTAPVIFVPTWVASAFRSNKLPMSKLVDANTLSQILNDEDLVDYAKFNEFSFIKFLVSSTALDHAVMTPNSLIFSSYLDQLRQISQNDKRLGYSKTLDRGYVSTYDFLDLALIYGALDKDLFLRKLSPIVEAGRGSRALSGMYLDLAKRSGLKTYQKLDSGVADMDTLDMNKHTGVGSMKFPVVKDDDKAYTKQLFENNMFKVVTTGSMVVVYIGEDYINYISGVPGAVSAYDLAAVMPKECSATTAQRFLLLSILQAMSGMQRADQFVSYMDSYLYKFYMATAQPQIQKDL